MNTEIESVEYTKMDVVRYHIRSAIQMMAIECHPFSIHNVAMAAKEIILQIAKKSNILIEWDHRIWVKKEHLADFLRLEKKAYNYFKHADRDTDLKYDGPNLDDLCHLNELQTLMNIHGYSKITGTREQDFDIFCNLILIRYPEYFKLEFLDRHPALKEQFQLLDRTKTNMILALRTLLFNSGLLPKTPPNVTLGDATGFVS